MDDLILVLINFIELCYIFSFVLQNNSNDRYRKKEMEFIEGVLTDKQRTLVYRHQKELEEERKRQKHESPLSFIFEEFVNLFK